MARSRNIKPSFFKNYDLADAGMACQLLFAGLWCMADKEGRLEDKPRLIKAELFPYYDIDVNRELTVLARLTFIYRYRVDGVDIIEVANFKKHQNPHHTEKASVLKGREFSDKTDDVSDCFSEGHDINGEVTVNSPSSNGEYLADSLIPDSLNTDSLIHVSQASPIEQAQDAPKKQTRFVKPTIEELNKLFIEKGSTKIEAEKFFNLYESNGWMVGKNKMKNWKAAAAGWISRQPNFAVSKPKEDPADKWNFDDILPPTKPAMRTVQPDDHLFGVTYDH